MSLFSIIKAIHISSAILSISLFLLRSYWLINYSNMLTKKTMKLLPHIVDSILLTSAFMMIYIERIPLGAGNPWITSKVVAVIFYILIGLYIFRFSKNDCQKYIALVINVLLYIYIISTAITKNPILF